MAEVGARAAYYGVVFDGDSLNTDPFGGTSYPDRVMSTRSGVYYTAARGAWTWSQLYLGNPTGQLPFAKRVIPYCNLAEFVVYIQVGGINGYALGQSGASVYGSEKSAALDVVAANAGAYIIGTTTLPSTAVTGGNETKRTDGNTLVVANADGAFDAVVNLAANTDLDDPADTNWYVDGTHPTAAGLAVMASLVGTALDAALAANGITP